MCVWGGGGIGDTYHITQTGVQSESPLHPWHHLMAPSMHTWWVLLYLLGFTRCASQHCEIREQCLAHRTQAMYTTQAQWLKAHLYVICQTSEGPALWESV